MHLLERSLQPMVILLSKLVSLHFLWELASSFFFKTFKLTNYHLLHLGNSGGIVGSVWGGRWSDYDLARQKAANGGNSYPEVSVPDFAKYKPSSLQEEHHQTFFFFGVCCSLVCRCD